MSRVEDKAVVHHTFSITRHYKAAPERVFKAFADVESKAKWFAGPETWVAARREMDFRIGGQEVLSGGPKGGTHHTFEAHYFDIVPNRRIIYGYDMYVGDRKLSVSLATIELAPDGQGTRLTMTEQGAFLEGTEDGSQRERGTQELLDKLGRSL